MMAELLKAVKRGNKKRSINITIGAVVGFLLSCTTLVAADDNYLWIKEDNGIKFSTDDGLTPANLDNPYSVKNTWNKSTKTYVNNIVLIGTNNGSSPVRGYGLKVTGNLGEFKFINNDLITGIFRGNDFGFGSGIYNNGIIRELINNGSIVGLSQVDTAFGISNDDIIIELRNNGLITGIATKNFGSGISNNGTIKELTNNSIVTGTAEIERGFGISNDGGSIITLTNNGLIRGIATGNFGSGISNIGTIKELTNNGIVTGIAGAERGFGICNADTITELKNNGSIIGTVTKSSGSGVYNIGIITELANTGLIIGIATENFGSGVYNNDIITELTNNSLIIGMATKNSGYGISNTGIIKKLTNNGSLIGTAAEWHGFGIYNNNVITELKNNGLITGTANLGSGIYNADKSTIENLINTGVIFGTSNAVKNYGGSINSANNYGILATKGNSVVEGTIIAENNYGLYIEGATGAVTAGSGGTQIVKFGNSEREMAIKNAAIEAGDKSTESFTFSGNPLEFDNSILNGKDKTLKVSGSGEIKGSIINAYGTAVLFDGADNQLTLSGTIVNGGTDETNNITVSGSSNGDILILQSGEITYKDSTGTQNTIINGNIDMGAGDDTLVLGNGTIINGNISMGNDDDILTIETGTNINGTLDGGSGSDTLNFNSPVTRTSNNGEINILHNISGFQEMNIDTNVTLFETTIGSDGKTTGLTVTDAENITIGANGVLTLRIDSINKTEGKIVGHALYGNNGTISSTGGKLLLALNGAGNESIISFGDMQLDSSLVTGNEAEFQNKITFDTTSLLHSVKRVEGTNEVEITALNKIPLSDKIFNYKKLNKIYQSILSVNELGNFDVDNNEKLSTFLGYLNDIYAGNPYSYSSELSRKSMGMFRDIVTENIFKPETNKWMIYGGLTHIDGGTKDTYYGKGYYTYDVGSSDKESDTKITGAYMLGEYGISDTLTSGVVVGGNKLKSDLSNGSKVDGDALYIGAYAKKYVGNLKVTAGAGLQYGDYDTDRLAVNRVASSAAESVMKYSDNYNDISYDIYVNGRYSNPIGDNLFLEPYGTLSYTYIKQDGADEGNKTLAIETDSKSFDYTSAKVGVDIKKVIPHEKGKSILSVGVSYTKIINGADEEHIIGRFKGGKDFDILVAHKNEHSIGLNAKYALELENGVLFDVKGSYAVERDSHNNSGKNKSKGEWIVGAGMGYKF